MTSDVKKETKRKHILESAFNLFLKNGYINTKIIDIAVSAGIGKGTVYEYFASKDEILLELINLNIKCEFEKLSCDIENANDLRSKLKVFLDFELSFLKTYGKYAVEMKQYMVDSASSQLSKEICNAIFELLSMEQESVSNLVDFGIKSGELRPMNTLVATHYILGCVSTYAMTMHRLPESLGLPIPTSKLLETNFKPDDVIDLILNGISA